MLANWSKLQMQQLLRRAFIAAAMAIEVAEVAATVAVEGGEGGMLAAAGATGARTAEWITTLLLSAASSIARHGAAIPPPEPTTPNHNVHATTVVCPATSRPTASTGSALRSNETKLGNRDRLLQQLQSLVAIAICFDYPTTSTSLHSPQQLP